MRNYSRTLKTTSIITLAFFLWSFGPLYSFVAYAGTKEGPGSRGQGTAKVRSSELGVRNGTPQSGERFEKALEAIRENVGKADDKARRGDAATGEIEAIKKQRIEIEKIDIELRKEFSATEKKLKDAKLPKEILDRHYKFVQHYEDNLKELKTNLNAVEQYTVDSKQEKEALRKTKLHLEKVKAPSKHQKLDPNNLPFKSRMAAKKIEPRLKKEDFERDFPQQKSKSRQKVAGGFDFHSAIRNPQSEISNKPILLAFNEPASDVPFQLPRPLRERIEVRGGFDSAPFAVNDFTLNSELSTLNYEVAQATGQPSADDLSETPDAQFTDAIRAKAQELGGKPLEIYEWVRNNIEYAPTYGSIQGADQCLQSKICNDIDTASLLIALLRVSGIYSHYEYSTIEIPIEQAMNWVGGVTEPKMVGTILATNGIPAKMLISGGTYKAVQLEHVYVSAFIDYIPSRGAVHKQGDTWIPLDPSFKQYTYTQGIDISAAVPFDAQAFADQLVSTATVSETGGYVTNVNSALVQQTMQDYQTQVQNYIAQNKPNATVGDVIGKKEIVKQEYPYLMGTLPYKTVQIGAEFAEIPSNYRATMSFSIPDQTGMGIGLSYSTTLPQIAGKKITLSFSPATANDQAVIESLLPALHADGTPIQPSELPSSFPAYLINLKPELRIDGQVVATGSPVTMGSAQSFTMSLNEPGIGVSNIDNIVRVGEYFGIGVDTGRINADRLQAQMAKLDSIKAKMKTQNYAGLTKDDVVGEFLYTSITSYFQMLDVSDEATAKVQGLIRYRVPSVGMYSVQLVVQEVFGIPKAVGSKSMMMDVDRIMQAVFSKNGNTEGVKQFMLASGSVSSALESFVPEQMYSMLDPTVQGISAVKALQLANDQGTPIYTINQTNVSTLIPQLQVSDDVKNDILNAVNAGKLVAVSKSNITFNGWTGCGYIITDPVTGAGAYMISGGQSGAMIALALAAVCPMLWFLIPYLAFDWEAIPCDQTPETCRSRCIASQPLTGDVASYLGGAAQITLTSVFLASWPSAAANTPLTLGVLISPIIFSVIARVIAMWIGASAMGCLLVCSNPCYYR